MNSIKKPLAKFILYYLRVLAKLQLKKINPIIIGVGGANGKTSLASLISLILKSKYKVLSSEGKNSESGISLTILGLKINDYSIVDWLKVLLLAPFKLLINWDKYQVYIAEMGIDSPYEPKNMGYLLKIIKPKIAALTNISYEHSVYFDGLVEDANEEERRDKLLQLTAQEELSLLNKLPSTATVILNIDDENINKEQGKIKANKITVSDKTKQADFYIKETEARINQFTIRFETNDKDYILKIKNPLPFHYAKTICMAIATAFSLGVSIEDSISQIEKHFMLPPGRFSLFQGVKNTLIIDSSYNNGIEPMLDSLDLVNTISKQRRKFAILGDLRELGSISGFAHEKVAEKIIKTMDFVVIVGSLMQKFVAPILESKNFPFKSFLNFSEARYFIMTNLKPKDVVFVKGSQNTLFLERAVEMLLKNPKDKEMLCRRGKFWDKKRQETS